MKLPFRIGKKEKSIAVSKDSIKHFFSADRAVKKLSEDKLGRSWYAQEISKALSGWKDNESLVVSLNGPWGFGKTSLKNLIIEHIKLTKENKPIIIEFTPWEWSTQKLISEALILEIASSIKKTRVDGRDLNKLAKRFYKYALSFGHGAKDLLDNIEELGKIVGGLFLLGALLVEGQGWKELLVGLTIITFFIKWILSFLLLFFPNLIKQNSLAEQKKQLTDSLRKLTSNIIIFVDDIDRLNQAEVREVFQLIKGNCDLPNLVFFLLMDYGRTARLLSDGNANGIDGEDYLDKIIQIPLDVPPFDDNKIDELLDFQIKEIEQKYCPGDIFSRTRWLEIYNAGISNYFENLRDVNRFVSTAHFYFIAHTKAGFLQVNPVDLLAIEALRVFEFDNYQLIQKNKELLTSNYSAAAQSQLKIVVEKLRVIATTKGNPIPSPNLVSLISELFPFAGAALSSVTLADNQMSSWRISNRICHPDIFDTYFHFKIPDDKLSILDQRSILESLTGSVDFLGLMQGLKDRGLLNEGLKYLESLLPSITVKSPKNIIFVLMGIAEGSEHYSWGEGNIEPIFWHSMDCILYILGESIEQESRVFELMQAFNIAKPFATLIGLVEHERSDTRKNIRVLRDSDLEQLENFWLIQLTESVKVDPLLILDNYRLSKILINWDKLDDSSELENWFKGYVESNSRNLFKFIKAAIALNISLVVGKSVSTRSFTVDRDFIERFTKFDLIKERVNAFPKESLTDDELVLVRLINDEASKSGIVRDQKISEASVEALSNQLYPSLTINPVLQKKLIKDLDARKYTRIGDLEQAHLNAGEFLRWYSQRAPKMFQHSTDYFTKALGYVDQDFLMRHGFSLETKNEIKRFNELKNKLSGALDE